mmetsp:Transcript_36305/g.95682  ORF Transcript_36305/g.95682 Transcript_36305/m.95682 type:complete len:230 (-) Transcript_36305:6-695(-)
MPRPRLVCVTCLHHVTKGSSHPSSIVKSIASTATSMKGITMSREDVAPRWSTTVRKARSPSAQFAKITAGRSCCGSAKVSSLLLSPLWPSALPGNWQSTWTSVIDTARFCTSEPHIINLTRMSSKYKNMSSLLGCMSKGFSWMREIPSWLNLMSSWKRDPDPFMTSSHSGKSSNTSNVSRPSRVIDTEMPKFLDTSRIVRRTSSTTIFLPFTRMSTARPRSPSNGHSQP